MHKNSYTLHMNEFSQKELEEQVKMGTANADIYYLLGLKTNDPTYFEKAVELNPAHVQAHYELARDGFTEGDGNLAISERALKHINKAIELDPAFWDAYELRASLYWTHFNDIEHALADVEHILKHQPGHAGAEDLKKQIEKFSGKETSSATDTAWTLKDVLYFLLIVATGIVYAWWFLPWLKRIIS